MEFPDACSIALSIALNHKDIAFILEVTGSILPKKYANAITQHEQKKEIFPHAKSIGNKRKQTEDRETFYVSNIVYIVSYPSKKADQEKVNVIKDLLKCSMPSAYFQDKKGFYKCGHLIAQFHNASMKFSINPCIVRTKKS